MKRGEFAHHEPLVDAVVDLVKVRLTALVANAIDAEFQAPHSRMHGELPALSLPHRDLQALAEGIYAAARQRAAQRVAEAVASRIAAGAGAGEKWLAAERALRNREQRAFDEYAQEQRDQADRRARIACMRHGPSPAPRLPKRSAASEAIRARIAALRLPSIQ